MLNIYKSLTKECNSFTIDILWQTIHLEQKSHSSRKIHQYQRDFNVWEMNSTRSVCGGASKASYWCTNMDCRTFSSSNSVQHSLNCKFLKNRQITWYSDEITCWNYLSLLFQAWRRTQYGRRRGRGPKTAPYRGNS